jgi:hypothetical protein
MRRQHGLHQSGVGILLKCLLGLLLEQLELLAPYLVVVGALAQVPQPGLQIGNLARRCAMPPLVL